MRAPAGRIIILLYLVAAEREHEIYGGLCISYFLIPLIWALMRTIGALLLSHVFSLYVGEIIYTSSIVPLNLAL